MVSEYVIRSGIVMVFTNSGEIVLSLIMLIFFGAAIVAGAIGFFGGAVTASLASMSASPVLTDRFQLARISAWGELPPPAEPSR
jgi:hypothetical protein